jgi:putative ABC transport system permease protein
VAQAASGRPAAIGELIVVVLLDKVGGGFSNVVLRGVPDDVLSFRPTVKVIEGRAPKPGTDEAMVGSAIRGRFKGLEVGQTFEMRKNRPIHVVGVFEDNGSAFESEVWGDSNVIRATFGRQGIVSSVRVRLTSPDKFDGFKAAIESNRQLNATTMRDSEFYEKSSQGTAKFLSILGFTIAFFFSVGAIIGAMITMHATVAQRQREIGTLRALGFARWQILVSFLLESVALSILGGVIGAGASLLMGMKRITMLNNATWSELSFKFEATPQILMTAIAIAAIMGILGGFFPAIRAARINPIQAMRGA